MEKEEIASKYGIDLKKLESEQRALAKHISAKDEIDFSKVEKIGGVDTIFVKNRIISAAVVINPQMEILDQQHFSDKARFPYIPGFRAYRELPAMLEAFNKLEFKPEVVFIKGHGIAHERLGLASHFGWSAGVSSIGVANKLSFGEVHGDDIIILGKKAGKVVITKDGAKPLYVSPGHGVGIKSAVELVRRFVVPPHKLPEPLALAHKHAKRVKMEMVWD